MCEKCDAPYSDEYGGKSSLPSMFKSDGRSIDWKRVEALRPWGGIRIEDDVIAQAGPPRNLTREAFAAG